MQNHVEDRQGDSVMYFQCPICLWEGDIHYSRRRPKYCSDACKQKAYRQRLHDANNVTGDELKLVTFLPKAKIERNIDMTLYLLRCNCKRSIWTVKGNIQIGKLACSLCNSPFIEQK